MNQKELNELRRRWKPDKNAISRIYGCFVNSNKEIITDLDESLGMMTQEEAEKYLSLLKKALSGALGKNLIDIVFSNQQVMTGEEHRMLMDLRTSGAKDARVRQAFYQKVIQSLDMGESNYLLLLASDSYDVPRRNRDALRAEGSDEVFSYILCAVCPVKTGKTELGYFSGDNEFHCAASQTVAAPELGFLFPAFDNRSANIYNALFYSRKEGELHQEFIDAVFHTDLPMSAAEQREAFESALSESLGSACSLEIVQAIHGHLAAIIEEHRETKDPEPLTVSPCEVSKIILDCGASEEQAEAFQAACGERFGAGAVLNPANLIDAKKVEAGVIGGYGAERVIHAQAAGVFMNVRKIGDLVEKGETIATIRTPEGAEIPVTAQIPGILRGLLRSGYPVTPGFKIADIDPRREELSNCFLISDKSRCIAGSVLELVCAQVWQ